MLSDEERKAIEWFREDLAEEKENCGKYNDYKKQVIKRNEKIFNLIEKQSKEIEELNKSDESKEQSSMNYYNLYRELVDKIKAKINELEEKRILARNSTIGIQIYDEIREQIKLLYSFLEKE